MSGVRRHGTPAQDKNTAQAVNVSRSPGALRQPAQLPWHWLPALPPPQHGANTRPDGTVHCGLNASRNLGSLWWPGHERVPPWVPCVLLSRLALRCCGCGTGAVLQQGAAAAVSSSSASAPAAGVGNTRQLCSLNLLCVY